MRKNERKINFNVDAYTAKLIGRENVSKLEGAILEIVKNAYDADAKVFCMYYSEEQKCIYILDNGMGMKESVLRDHWMTIGNSSKKYSFRSVENRIQTGAKGIGRFALDRLSDHCEMLTISAEGGLEWIVDWRDFDGRKKLSEVKAQLYDTDETLLGYMMINSWKNREVASMIGKLDLGSTGTVFRLSGLHDEWNRRTIEKVRNHLENLLPPDVVNDFDIYFFDDETGKDEAKIVSAHLDSYDYKIEFRVREEALEIEIIRNEFDFGEDEKNILNEAGIPEEEIPYFHGRAKKLEFSFPEMGEKKNIIGDYGGILFFNKITASKKDMERFYYKDIKGRRNLTREFGGIKLYRDHFRVRPYGEYGDNDFDWLELAPRVRRSQAGPGSKGEWRVASEQMTGMIDISRENTNLEDAANRNGIREGAGFDQLKRILLFVITEFERDRQYIGRKLAQYRKMQDKLTQQLEELHRTAEARRQWEQENSGKGDAKNDKDIDQVDAPTLNPEAMEKLVESLKERQEEEVKELQDEAKMLQTLATTGIVTNMFMHEIRTLTNNIGQELDAAYEAIKYDHDMEGAFNNIRQAIGFKKHFASWFNVTIDSIRKDKRKRRLCNISEMMNEFLKNWKSILERSGVKLFITCDGDVYLKCFAFDIENIISNLISNSLASFDKECETVLEKREIYLHIKKREYGFVLYYEDTGWGLSEKYKKRPDIIMEAFESDKGGKEEDGTGMGMWIVKRTVMEYNGAIDLSVNKSLDKGFKVVISLGGMYV